MDSSCLHGPLWRLLKDECNTAMGTGSSLWPSSPMEPCRRHRKQSTVRTDDTHPLSPQQSSCAGLRGATALTPPSLSPSSLSAWLALVWSQDEHPSIALTAILGTAAAAVLTRHAWVGLGSVPITTSSANPGGPECPHGCRLGPEPDSCKPLAGMGTPPPSLGPSLCLLEGPRTDPPLSSQDAEF